jgi:enoyl-CoA hydratase
MIDYRRFAEQYHLLVDLEDTVAKVTINRPERMNAITIEMHQGLEDLLQLFNHDDRVNAIVITGAGDRAFCAGADVKTMASQVDRGEDRQLGGALKPGRFLIHHFLNLQQPIVAAINGHAVGLGATIALMCDITIMSDKAVIGDTHASIGLVAGDGGALMWPFLIGMNHAKELLMTGRRIRADEAERIGLVNRVAPHGQVMAEAMAVAKELASGAPLAVQWTKAALNQHIWQQAINTHHFALAVECLTLASEDNVEGARAFAAKRPAQFRGR